MGGGFLIWEADTEVVEVDVEDELAVVVELYIPLLDLTVCVEARDVLKVANGGLCSMVFIELLTVDVGTVVVVEEVAAEETAKALAWANWRLRFCKRADAIERGTAVEPEEDTMGTTMPRVFGPI